MRTSKGVSADLIRLAQKSILDRFVQERSWKVLERERLSDIQSELALQQSGLIDSRQIRRIGKMLAANKLLLGEMQVLKDGYLLHLRIVDVERARVEFSEKTSFSDPSNIQHVSEDLADRLVRRMTGRAQIRSYYTGLVPGWTQFERGQELWGWGFSVLSAALLVGHVDASRRYDAARSRQEDLIVPLLIARSAGANATLANLLYLSPLEDDLNQKANRLNATGLTLAAVWIANYIHALWFEPKLGDEKPEVFLKWNRISPDKRLMHQNQITGFSDSRITIALKWRFSL